MSARLCAEVRSAARPEVKIAAEKSMCFNLNQCTGPSVGTADCSGCAMASDCASLRRRLTDGRRQVSESAWS